MAGRSSSRRMARRASGDHPKPPPAQEGLQQRGCENAEAKDVCRVETKPYTHSHKLQRLALSIETDLQITPNLFVPRLFLDLFLCSTVGFQATCSFYFARRLDLKTWLTREVGKRILCKEKEHSWPSLKSRPGRHLNQVPKLVERVVKSRSTCRRESGLCLFITEESIPDEGKTLPGAGWGKALRSENALLVPSDGGSLRFCFLLVFTEDLLYSRDCFFTVDVASETVSICAQGSRI